MSEHLLPVATGNEGFPVTYRNIIVPTYNDEFWNTHVVEHNGILFCLKQNSYDTRYPDRMQDGKAYLEVLNLFTGEMTHYAEFNYATDLNSGAICGMLVDDNQIYFSLLSDSFPNICIFKLKDSSSQSLQLEKVGSYKYSINACTACGKILWYDKNNICMFATNDVLMFDINRHTFSSYNHGNNNNIRDFAIGRKFIIATRNYNSSPSAYVINWEAKTCTTLTLPTTQMACVTYYDGKFYFVNANYLYIYDETTETVTTTKNIPWTVPVEVCSSDYAIYVLSQSSSRAYIYDYIHDEYKTFLLAWSVPGLAQNSNTRGCVSENFWFVYRNTLMICDYSGYSKYNFGYKYDSVVVLCNAANIQKFTYDSRFVSFAETFMFVHDGDLEYTFEPVEDLEHIKSVTISKSDYKFINSLQFTSE